MKNVKKNLFLSMLMLLVLFCATEVSVSAKSILQNGLDVSLVTQKQSYESTEGISAKLLVTNTNRYDVKNLQLEIITPEGYSLQEKPNGSMQMEVLSSGKSAELNTVFILNSSNGTQQNTPNSTNMGMIILIIVGATVVILIAAVFIILLFKKRSKKLFCFVFLLLALGAAAMPKVST